MEFAGFGCDLSEPVREPVQEAARWSCGKGAAEHFQNMLSDMEGIEHAGEVGLGRTDRGRESS